MAKPIFRASIGKVYILFLLLSCTAFADQVNCIKWKNLDATTAATYCKPFSVRAGSGVAFSNNDLDRVLTISSTGSVAGAGGADTQLQFNLGGVLSGSSGLTWNDSTKTLTATHITGISNRPYIDMIRDCSLVADGVTDDYAAAQACLNLYPGWAFYFPPTKTDGSCSYWFTATLKPTGEGSTIFGASSGFKNAYTTQGGTVLCWAAGVTGIELDLTGQSCSGCNIRDISLQGSEGTHHLVTPTELNIPSGANLPLTSRNISAIQRTMNVLTVTTTRAGAAVLEGLTQQVGSTVKISGVVGDSTMNGECIVATLSGGTTTNPLTFTCPQNGSDSGPFGAVGTVNIPTTGASSADGVRICTNFATIIHTVIVNFGRHAINADSSAADAMCPSPFSDDLIIRDSTLMGNQGDGYLCSGNDCNAHLLSGNSVYYNVLWGLEDQSSLGNTHIGNQLSNGGHSWASSTTPTTKAISSISRTLSGADSTVTVVLSVADANIKLGSCVVIAGVTDASFNSTAGQCFFITSFTDSTHYSYIQPGAPVDASSSGGTSRMAKFGEAYLSAGVDDGAQKIGTRTGSAQFLILNQYVEGGQLCKWGAGVITIVGANTPGACASSTDFYPGGYLTAGCSNGATGFCIGGVSAKSFVKENDFADQIINFKAGMASNFHTRLEFLKYDGQRGWVVDADPNGTLGDTGSYIIERGGAFRRFTAFGGGSTRLDSEGGATAVEINKTNGQGSGTAGLEVWSGGVTPALYGKINSAGITASGTGLVTVGSTVVASLPSAASNPGAMIRVSDSTTVSAEGQTCVGSSSNNALAFSNGSVWKCF